MSFVRKAHYLMQHGSTNFRQYCQWRRNNLIRQEGKKEVEDGLEQAAYEKFKLPEVEGWNPDWGPVEDAFCDECDCSWYF